MASSFKTIPAKWEVHLRAVRRSGRDSDPEKILVPQDVRESGIEAMGDVGRQCESVNLRASLATVEKIIAAYRKDECTLKVQNDLFDELNGRIIDELHEQYFLSLDSSEAARFEQWDRGWKDVIERFPETVRDVEEMNKCFALGRYTASMFHALHVAEWGAINLGIYIGVADPKKGWGATERSLRELLKLGHANLPANLSSKFEFLEQMNREIDSMVLAWRHKVDHAANRLAIVPNTDFTPDIAEHIIGAVRIFMQRLCEGIPV